MKKTIFIIPGLLMALSLSGCQSNVNSDNVTAESTSYTIEELTAMIEDFEQKTKGISSNNTDSNMDQFLSLKKERKQLERLLDNYEDTLEKQYRSGSLSRDEYKDKNRELDALDDRLDDVEDRLEIAFNIDEGVSQSLCKPSN